MNVAWIIGHQIFPAITGGHLRSASIIGGLAAAGCTVRIYALTGRRQDYGRIPGVAMDAPLPGVEQWVNRRWLHGSLQAVGRRAGVPPLWQGVVPERVASCARLAAVVAASDVVVADFPFTVPTAARVRGAKPLVLVSHGLEYELMRRPLWRSLVRRREQAAARAIDGLIACDLDDARFYGAARPELPILQLPNGVAVAGYEHRPEDRERLRRQLGVSPDQSLVMFTGSRFWPNVEALEAIKRFAADNGPRLAALRMKFLIVGSVEPEAYDTPHVMATGPLPGDVKPYFSAADAAINPVVSGSGSNIKMVEYLAARLPILSTTFGAREMALDPGKDYGVLDGGAAWISALEGLVATPMAVRQGVARANQERNLDRIDMGAMARSRLLPWLASR